MKLQQDFERGDEDIFAGRHVRDRHLAVERMRYREPSRKRLSPRQVPFQEPDLSEHAKESSAHSPAFTSWFHDIGGYEFEVSYETGTYTGWYRCIDGRLADGRWPEWNSHTGEKRYSH